MMKPLETWKNQHTCNPTQTQQTSSHHQIPTNEAILESACTTSLVEKQPDAMHIMAEQHAHEMSTGDNVV